MFNKLKQFKDLRSQAKQFQNTLAAERVEGSADWGKVKITLDGNQEVLSVHIDPELLTIEKKAKLESAIKDAIGDATKKLRDLMAKKMRSGELKMPDLGQFGA